ncbi:hypothetical protein D8674_005880 [Pyrus ussuriensis x Pyrus communis]|uniref:Uncharacterized protein n=1 Tax=Pyrus ussuriensis x Pyrus communis TaxID=2448454 RepID=A0A5N5FT07_9ROSA|nr:hypothetical protein D8674_005880 [Pyrus ussuriensis x Pyrus communis]
MSQLIRTQRAITSTPKPMTKLTIATTALPEMDHRLVNLVDPVGHPAPQVLASCSPGPRILDQMSPSGSTTDASGTQPVKKNTQGPCRQLKTAKVTQLTNDRIIIGYGEQHRAAPMAEQNSALAHDVGHIMWTFCPMRWKSWKAMPEKMKNTSDLHQYFKEGCPKEFEDRQDSCVWLCSHFQEPGYMGSKFSEINVFADVYVQPGDELTEPLHPSVPPKYVSSIFLHHRPQSPYTPSMHSNQARRPPTPSPTLPPTSSKITKHLQTTCL